MEKDEYYNIADDRKMQKKHLYLRDYVTNLVP